MTIPLKGWFWDGKFGGFTSNAGECTHIWYKRIVIKLLSSSPTENIELESKLVSIMFKSIRGTGGRSLRHWRKVKSVGNVLFSHSVGEFKAVLRVGAEGSLLEGCKCNLLWSHPGTSDETLYLCVQVYGKSRKIRAVFEYKFKFTTTLPTSPLDSD